MNIIEIEGNKYNLDHFVAIEEVAINDGGASEYDGRPTPKEFVISFSGGVKLRLPLTERERIEQLILGHQAPR